MYTQLAVQEFALNEMKLNVYFILFLHLGKSPGEDNKLGGIWLKNIYNYKGIFRLQKFLTWHGKISKPQTFLLYFVLFPWTGIVIDHLCKETPSCLLVSAPGALLLNKVVVPIVVF